MNLPPKSGMVVLLRPDCDVNPPRLSPHLDAKKFFDAKFEFYSLSVFQRAIARLCTSNKTLNVTKTLFPGVDALPTSPVTSLPPLDFRVIHMQK